MIDNLMLKPKSKTFSKPPYTQPEFYINTACECGKWEAVVKFNGQKLCPKCAWEEGIEVL